MKTHKMMTPEIEITFPPDDGEMSQVITFLLNTDTLKSQMETARTYTGPHSNPYMDDFIASGINPKNHTYASPYERSDRFNLLRSENDRSTLSQLEPELGYMLYADVDFEYNYYSSEYENSTALKNQNYKFLPDLNLWLVKNRNDQNEDGIPDYNISSTHEDAYVAMFAGYNTAEGEKYIDDSLSKHYFENYPQLITHYTNVFYTELAEYMDVPDFGEYGDYAAITEFVNKTALEIYADDQNIRENFPFYAKFSLSGVEKSEFCNLLEQNNLEKKFIDFLIMHRDENTIEDCSYRASFLDYTEDIVSDIRAYSIDAFYNHVNENHTHGTESVSATSPDESTCEYFENFIRHQIFLQKVNDLLGRTSEQTSFPVAFRLEKTPSEGGHVDVKYFFNYNDLQEFKLYDSQVRYREGYTYTVKVINAIVNPLIPADGGTASIYNTIIFLEEPYYEENIYILDSPPIAPDVDLITYRGIDNKVLILFNQMVDQKVESPVIINESDWEGTFQWQYAAQGIDSGTPPDYNPILFESDDPTDFEIFKCLKHPVSYDDFRNEHYRFVSSGNPKMTAASFEDTITPNQTYYYMFRAQDVHGHVSNPSAIYEFTLNKEGETLFPKLRIVDFAKPEPPLQKNKTFKKYLKIGFSPRQYQIPSDQIAHIGDTLVGGDIDIGISDDNIIGSNRKFKFRIRSKNTGKLLDINVTFKKNNVIKA